MLDMSLLELPWVKGLLGLVIGLVLGSFTTMLSYRLPKGLSIVSPPSQCPTCHTRLTVRDLIPVLSWLAHKGCCRHCQKKIGLRYLVIEVVTAALTIGAFLTVGINWQLVAVLLAIVGFVAFVTVRMEKR